MSAPSPETRKVSIHERSVHVCDFIVVNGYRVNRTLLVVLLQSQREGLEEPFGSHEIGKERHHEISAHFWWHQQRQHSQRSG
jgi:hypothetical protein